MGRKHRWEAAVAAVTMVTMVLFAPAGPASASPSGATAATSGATPNTYLGNGYYEIGNVRHIGCMTAVDTRVNSKVAMTACLNNEFQSWLPVAAGPTDTYYLVNRYGGYCLEANGDVPRPGELVYAFTCNGHPEEQWQININVINGAWYGWIRNAGTMLCLETGGVGVYMEQVSCDPNEPAVEAQIWLFS